MNSETIVFRQRFFQYFLNRTLSIGLLKNSPVFYDFLTITDEAEFLKRKSKYSECDISRIVDTVNLEGIVYSRFSQDLALQQKYMREYLLKSNGVLDQLSLSYQLLKENFKQISANFLMVGELHGKLKKIGEDYGGLPSTLNYFDIASKMNNELSILYSKQVDVIETEFKSVYDFLNAEILCFKNESNYFNDLKAEYLTNFTTLCLKKEKLFNTQNISKWEIPEDISQKLDDSILSKPEEAFKYICYKSNLTLEEERRRLGVCCNSILTDFKQFRTYYDKVFQEKLVNISSNNSRILGDIFGLVKLLHLSTYDL